jgi:hypothetical protein
MNFTLNTLFIGFYDSRQAHLNAAVKKKERKDLILIEK